MFGDRLHLMREELPHLQGLHLLPGCGHWTQEERPDEVNRILVDWLRAL
jgi:pimeloyl-ACP methyl ester carboxylesterase